jgi:hypothetical protein
MLCRLRYFRRLKYLMQYLFFFQRQFSKQSLKLISGFIDFRNVKSFVDNLL